MAAILVEGLVKHFQVHQRDPGLGESVRSLFRRQKTTVRAVDGISFTIEPGEVVGFLGPNGAGKTTTLKCLSGLLYPTAGSIQVLGFIPHQRRPDFLSSFTLVMGQRNQLFWDLPAMETFLVNQAIYRIPGPEFKATLDQLVELLELGPYLQKQVRNLSLGERMRCELAAALLHRPKVLFLDEPTLGLDVNAQAAIREFMSGYNQTSGATVLLTSHYMADVTALAKRVIVIHQGTLRYDGDLRSLVEATAPYRHLKVTLDQPVDPDSLARFGEVESIDGTTAILKVTRTETAAAASSLLAALPVADLAIEDPPIEDIIRRVFASQ